MASESYEDVVWAFHTICQTFINSNKVSFGRKM